ncbi:MAG: hypothetical protein AVDCRST_MAG26-3112 [uncultured Chloroflexia bacterium]|uniref:Uncharacterized protein n=1 Tax=uncultured Chloroflexia bacterium TaxID=1672391 RepID=A0A6J4JHI9_9CHLR|nr:MAG: hypothetical protein AVDCRST_MAG26-3112 [uncultured Chloroflexia bacterium]
MRAGFDQVLAVVQDQQELLVAQVVDQDVEERTPRLFAHAERGRHALHNQRRIQDGRQLDEPHAVDELLHELRGCFKREPRLAGTTGTGQGQEMCGAEQAFDLGKLSLASDERRELDG